ncbi:hypothetical protein FZEAL_4220 [Fusarium zealandicum]|uniref:Uncharacterized protein n=1 Tax=Fusarium zealandicum TaxID=1053134 RepID=A0A8H4UMA9_9HYPO|nr:hypothetical protein FZEAL_4220 [Fusarium zealandicum]
MDFNYGQDAASGSGSGASTNWLGFGGAAQRATVASSSPGAPNAIAGAAHDIELDDASFAESYRPETSPLFNPMFLTRTTAAEAAPSLGLSPNPAPSWPWQRDSSVLDGTFNNDSLASPTAPGLPIHTPGLSSPSVESESNDAPDPVRESIGEPAAFSPPHAPFSPLEESAARAETDAIFQQQTAEESQPDETAAPEPVLTETRIEIYEHTETIIQSSEKEPEPVPSQEADRAIVPGSDGVGETPQQTPPEPTMNGPEESAEEDEDLTQELSESQEPTPAAAAASGISQSALLSIESEATKRMSAPPGAIPSARTDSPHARRALSTPSQVVVELRSLSEPEKATFSSEMPASDDVDDSATPKSTTKRRRRTDKDLLVKAAGNATKGPRTRPSHASAPTSPAVKKAPASAAKRARKSMPATAVTADTPKKRGRPRKSDAVATPATAPTSTAKRGRPRKSDATPIAVPIVAKAQPARGRRAASASKATAGTPQKTTTVRVPRTAPKPRTVPTPQSGRTRKVTASDDVTPIATPATTPKRRGRPPKSAPQPEVGGPKSAGRATRSADATPAKKPGRVIKPSAVPSPIKRGRPARAAAVSSPKAEPKPATRRRGATKEPKDEQASAGAPVEAPKKRGRPARNAAVTETVKPAAEPKTRKRGRVAEAEDVPAEEPATKKRGRAAKAVKNEVKAPATKRTRGAAKAPEEVAAEPAPAKKRAVAATSKKMAKNAASGPEIASPKKRGRPTASPKVAEDVATETKKPGRPKRSAAQAETAPEPPTKKRRTNRQTEEPAPKEKAPATGRKTGRPAKVTKATPKEVAPTRAKSTRSKPEEPEVKPAAKPRGRAAAAKKSAETAVEEEPAKPKARGRPAKAKAGKGEIPSSKSADSPATKRGRGAKTETKAKGAGPTGVVKKGRAAQTGVRRGLRSRG